MDIILCDHYCLWLPVGLIVIQNVTHWQPHPRLSYQRKCVRSVCMVRMNVPLACYIFPCDMYTKYSSDKKWSYLHGAYAGEVDLTIVLFRDALFHLSGCVNSQNDRYWLVCRKVHVNLWNAITYVMVGVWCAISVTRIIGPCFWGNHKFTPICYTRSDPVFWTSVRLQENFCSFFSPQYFATANTANNFLGTEKWEWGC